MNLLKAVSRKIEWRNSMKTIIYTADDEEPKCDRCCHACDDESICMERCGPEYAWSGYERLESIEDRK